MVNVHSSLASNHAGEELSTLTKRERELLAHGRLKPNANQVNRGYQETQVSRSSAPLAYIEKIQLGLMDPDHLRAIAAVKVNKATLKCKGFPAKNSVNSTQMGPPDRNHTCITCHQSICKCDGAARFGIVELAAPVYHSWMLSKIAKIANLTCFNCGHLAINTKSAKFKKIEAAFGKDPKALLDKLLAASKRITRCDCTSHTPWLQPKRAEAERAEADAKARADAAQAAVDAAAGDAAAAAAAHAELDAAKLALRAAVSARARFSSLQYDFQFEGVVLMKRLKALKKKDGKEISDEEREQWAKERDWHEVSPKRLREVFASMTDEEIVHVGMDPVFSRPEWMLLTVLSLPEMGMRPVVTYSSGGKTQSEDPLTRQLQAIVKVNQEATLKVAEIMDKMVQQQQQQQQQQQPSGSPGLGPATPSKLRRIGPVPPLAPVAAARKKTLSTITAMISAEKERKKAERARQESKLSLAYDADGAVSIAAALHVDPIDLRTIDASKFDPWSHPATKEIMEELQYKIALYFKDNIKAKVPKRHRQRSQNKSKTSQQQRLIKKRGHVRGSMLAKRVDFSGRSVLSPDPNLRPNEIGLPRIVCKELTVSEIVDETNYVQLLRAVRNGPEVYPGANAVILDNGDVIDLRYINRYKFQLRFGMIVERHLIDGDEVIFNRQPSLHKMSMMGHRVVVHDWMTIRLNLAALSPYNADCDGDTIIIHVPQKATTRNEVREIMDVSHQTLTPQSNKPVMGLIQDTVWAIKQMTLRDVLMSDEDFHSYASKSQVPNWQRNVGRPAVLVRKAAILGRGDDASDDDGDDAEYDVHASPVAKDSSSSSSSLSGYVALRTGKQLFSTVLPRGFHLTSSDYCFQFDTTTTTTTTNAEVAATAEEEEEEEKNALHTRIALAEVWLKDMDIAILDGEQIRGSPDSSITGKSSNGIAHNMALENTPAEIQAFFSGAQKVTSPWTADEGLSVGTSDLTLSLEQRRKIDDKMRRMLFAVQTYERLSVVTNRQIQGARTAVQRQISEAHLEKLEQKLCVALNDITTHLGEDAMDMAGPTNRMVQMISLAKSKGDKFNFTQMVVALGQQIVFGARIAIEDRITSHHPNRADHFLPIPEEKEEKEEKEDAEDIVAPFSPNVPGVTLDATAAVTVENDDVEFAEEAAVALDVDMDYEADGLAENGFIASSYRQGLSPYQFYSHSMGGREGLLQTSEKTKETGYCQRRLSKAMENNIVANDMSVRNGNGQIVERLYGRDGFDATFMRRARLSILSQSNADVQRALFPSAAVEMESLWDRECALRPSPYAVESRDLLRDICQAEIAAINAYKVELLKQKLHFSGDTLAYDVQVPANVDRALFRVAFADMKERHRATYVRTRAGAGAGAAAYVSTPLAASVLVRTMRSFVERLYSYYPVSFNRLWAFELLLLSKFSTRSALFEWKLSFESLQAALRYIEQAFTRTLIQPGEMVGSLASQMLSATFTQNALDFFKHAGVGSVEDGGAEGNVEEIIDLRDDPESGAMRVYLLPFEDVEDLLPSHIAEGIHAYALQEHTNATAAVERATAAHVYAQALLSRCTMQADNESRTSAARVAVEKTEAVLRNKHKALLTLANYQQRRLCSLVGREMLDYNLEYLIEENALIPEDDAAWLSVAEQLLTPTDRAQLAKRSECVLRFVISVERCARLGVTRQHVQQCIHDYLQENVVYDWSAPVGAQVDGREIRSDIGCASALPCSESALLQYTEELVKQRDVAGAGAGAIGAAAAAGSFTPPMQDEKNTFAIILLSPQLQQEIGTLAPAAAPAAAAAAANWVVRVYIHPDSKHYKQFCKNPQVEEGGASEIVKLLGVDICHNARVHGIKGVSETNVVTEVQETVNEALGCVEKRVGFVITTKGSNILDVLSHPLVDTRRTTTTHLHEALNVWGIKTSATLLWRILKKKLKAIGTYVDHRHILELVETMTHRGQFMKIRRHDMNRIKTSGALQRISFEQPVEVVTDASCSATIEPLQGVSENVMVGKIGPMGTATRDVRLADQQQPDEATKRQHIQHMHEKVLTELNDLDRGVFLYASGREQIHCADAEADADDPVSAVAGRARKRLRLGSLEEAQEQQHQQRFMLKRDAPYSGDLCCDLSREIEQKRAAYQASLDLSSLQHPIDHLRSMQLRSRQQYAASKCMQDHELMAYSLPNKVKANKATAKGKAIALASAPVAVAARALLDEKKTKTKKMQKTKKTQKTEQQQQHESDVITAPVSRKRQAPRKEKETNIVKPIKKTPTKQKAVKRQAPEHNESSSSASPPPPTKMLRVEQMPAQPVRVIEPVAAAAASASLSLPLPPSPSPPSIVSRKRKHAIEPPPPAPISTSEGGVFEFVCEPSTASLVPVVATLATLKMPRAFAFNNGEHRFSDEILSNHACAHFCTQLPPSVIGTAASLSLPRVFQEKKRMKKMTTYS